MNSWLHGRQRYIQNSTVRYSEYVVSSARALYVFVTLPLAYSGMVMCSVTSVCMRVCLLYVNFQKCAYVNFWFADISLESKDQFRVSRSSGQSQGHGSKQAKNAGRPPTIETQFVRTVSLICWSFVSDMLLC